MKRILTFLFLTVLLVTTATAQGLVPEKALYGQPVKLDKVLFMKYVYDYEKHPQEWVYNGSKPCIVDFYADWCAPCRKLSPILEEIAKEYKGEVIVYKVDTEAQRELAAQFAIRSLPTIIFVPVKGDPQAAMGLMPKEDLVEAIEDVLKVKKPASTKI